MNFIHNKHYIVCHLIYVGTTTTTIFGSVLLVQYSIYRTRYMYTQTKPIPKGVYIYIFADPKPSINMALHGTFGLDPLRQ